MRRVSYQFASRSGLSFPLTTLILPVTSVLQLLGPISGILLDTIRPQLTLNLPRTHLIVLDPLRLSFPLTELGSGFSD